MAMIIYNCLKEERKILNSAQLSSQVTLGMCVAILSTLSYYLGQREWKKTERENRPSSFCLTICFFKVRRVNTDMYQLDSVACLCSMKHLEGKWPRSNFHPFSQAKNRLFLMLL